MKIITIYRLPQNGLATHGVMVREDGTPFCLTLERPWKNNERGVSCIPVGERRMVSSFYHRGNHGTYEILCPPRELILFHMGNIDEDTHGCIILGESYEPILNKVTRKMEDGIAASGHAFWQFMDYMGGDKEGTLVIKEIRY